MRVIQPVTVTDAVLSSSTATENDYAAWAAGTAYSVGDRVIRTQTHRIYERLVAGTTATAPENDATNWLDVAPTNRWAMFDTMVQTGTQLGSSQSIVVVLVPGRVSALALFGLVGSQLTVAMTDGAGGPTVYSRSVPLLYELTSWYEWFFEDDVQLEEIALIDLPPYPSGYVTVTISPASGTSRCGLLTIGSAHDLGDTNHGATVGIVDYSRKETDDFGVTTFVRRPYSKRMSARMTLASGQIARVQRRLAALRATPCAWVGHDDTATYAPLMVFGFYRDFSIDVAYPTQSACSLEIEGLI